MKKEIEYLKIALERLQNEVETLKMEKKENTLEMNTQEEEQAKSCKEIQNESHDTDQGSNNEEHQEENENTIGNLDSEEGIETNEKKSDIDHQAGETVEDANTGTIKESAGNNGENVLKIDLGVSPATKVASQRGKRAVNINKEF